MNNDIFIEMNHCFNFFHTKSLSVYINKKMGEILSQTTISYDHKQVRQPSQ